MIQMDNRISTKEYIEYIMQKQRSKKEQQVFVDAVLGVNEENRPNNRCVENTVVYETLSIILDKTTKAFHKSIPDKMILYRARELGSSNMPPSSEGISVKKDGGRFVSTGYDVYGSKESPFGIYGAGRANIAGMSYLYLAEDEYTACAEIKPLRGAVVSLATFETQKELNLIDFKDDYSCEELQSIKRDRSIEVSELVTWIMMRFAIPVKTDKEYYITQLIADYIRRAGYDGVRFKSSMSGGANITLFNSHESFIKFTSSKLVYIPEVKYRVLDLNSEKSIENTNCYDTNDSDEIKRVQDYLIRSLT